jgi:acyl-CoA hydrolase
MGPDAIASRLRPGDTIAVAQVLGEPVALLEELYEALVGLEGITLFVGMSLTGLTTRPPANVRVASSVGMGANTEPIASGRMELVPCHMSALPWLLTEGPYAADVACVTVSPPDSDGFCSLAMASDYAWPVVQNARTVLAEINDQVPAIAGDTRVHLDRLAYTVRTSRPLPQYPLHEPTARDVAIAEGVARYVHDGSCLQIGIGKLGEAVLRAVADRRDLGVHSGMVGDTLLEMMAAGVITGKGKAVDAGLAVAGSVLGSDKAIALAGERPELRLRSITHTHDPHVIGSLSAFVCINSGLEVDLFGQVNSEVADGRYIGAIGGSVDFLRASVRAPGGRSVVALPATTGRGRSRIVPRVEQVTALGADVDVLVTEYGVAEVAGLSPGERAHRILGIAAPEHRDTLRAELERIGL